MYLIYLFPLVVALGVLIVQMAMGGKGDADGVDDHDLTGHGHTQGQGAAREASKDPGAESESDTDHAAPVGETNELIAIFLSLRFWIFSALGFGLSGSLLTLFALAGPVVVFVLAAGSGLISGLFAQFAFRAVARGSTSSTGDVTRAAGTIGRVLVPISKGKIGQIRVVLQGQNVDMRATSEEDFARGAHVLVEDVEDSIARVSKRPSVLD